MREILARLWIDPGRSFPYIRALLISPASRPPARLSVWRSEL